MGVTGILMTEWDSRNRRLKMFDGSNRQIGRRFHMDLTVRHDDGYLAISDGLIESTVTNCWCEQTGCQHLLACHVSISEWPLYRIEASLRLPCISYIYEASQSLIFAFPNRKRLSERTVNLVRAIRRVPVTTNYHNRHPFCARCGKYLLQFLKVTFSSKHCC